jgi:hypothetical protein
VSEGLRALNQVTRVLRARRAEQGALSLASPEVKFELDTETHDPLDVGVYQVCRSAMCFSSEWLMVSTCPLPGTGAHTGSSQPHDAMNMKR